MLMINITVQQVVMRMLPNTGHCIAAMNDRQDGSVIVFLNHSLPLSDYLHVCIHLLVVPGCQCTSSSHPYRKGSAKGQQVRAHNQDQEVCKMVA